MAPLFYLANALVMPPAMYFAWNYYRYNGKQIRFGRLWISMILLLITVVVTGLQFPYPEIIPALNRDPQALSSGEWWRIITSLFIQPAGIWQCIFNALFFISFVPLAEHLYGRGLILIYFVGSLIGQMVILYWETTPGGLGSAGGGSSTALYAVMGALFMYIMMNRRIFPRAYILIPVAGLVGATALLFFEDGHAPLLANGWNFRTTATRNQGTGYHVSADAVTATIVHRTCKLTGQRVG